MLTAYGSLWTSKWSAVNDIEEVYSDWADDLGAMSLGAIKWAIDSCRKDEMPPSVGQFISRCKQYKPPEQHLAIARKFTPEEMQANRERIAKIMEDLAKSKVMPSSMQKSIESAVVK